MLDLGAGTGLFSLMAARAGAERVYACEASEVQGSKIFLQFWKLQVMAMTCREVLLCNPEGSRVRLIPRLSLDMDKADIPEQVPRHVFCVSIEHYNIKSRLMFW